MKIKKQCSLVRTDFYKCYISLTQKIDRIIYRPVWFETEKISFSLIYRSIITQINKDIIK